MFNTLPLFIRKFIVDFVETAIATILALNLIFPTSISETKQVAITIGLALLSAAVSAVRRGAPEFVTWLRDKLGVTDAGSN